MVRCWTRQVIAKETDLYLVAGLVAESCSTDVNIEVQVKFKFVDQLIQSVYFLSSQVFDWLMMVIREDQVEKL